ncbi:discoidin domain-containing protein [Clostridium sp. D33t1_170424_F3]|uniref:discoidin domain-containing protein n=1 Tax=Clostridium sp. D33t1_170424_F3 TaxID=2787099 RepID=UPI0018AC836B|nr:discoidin domain-containing protein [Clostridium sp. D33t1_170424_F3]
MKRNRFREKLTAFVCAAALLVSSIPVSLSQAAVREDQSVRVPQFLMEATASSQEETSDTCYASMAVDGNAASIWHTQWSATPPSPHWIAVDLGRIVEISRLTYLPRQDGNQNGYVKKYEISVSNDGQTYTKAAEGDWIADMTEKEAVLQTPVSGRYVKLQAVSASMMSCAELNIYASSSPYTPLWNSIDETERFLAGTETGSQPNQYPQDAADALNRAIEDAKLKAVSLPESDPEGIQTAADALRTALDAFHHARITYTKEQLAALAEQANTLNDGTPAGEADGEASEQAKRDFQSVLHETEAVLNNSEADKETVHLAYETLVQAMETFKDRIVTSLKSLAGVWELKLGAYSADDGALSDTCVLPGTLDENRKGNLNTSVNTNRLSCKYTYTGDAVYQKQVFIPQNWEGKHVTFLMERTKNTRVWVNGQEQTDCNANNTLGVAQEYTLTGLVPGQENTLTVQVRNTDYPVGTGCHMLTEETVTNWNGILGKIELKAADPVFLKDVRVYPNIQDHTATVKAVVANDTGAAVSGSLTLNAQSYNHDGAPHIVPQMVQAFSLEDSEAEMEITITYAMGENVRLWSEFDPSMYRLTVDLAANGAADSSAENFGMREFKTSGTKFTINGLTTFMRGEGNSAVFPLTGYPYMTKAEWIDFFTKAQDLGINFFRFHSWTPPEAAFEAADELGIYMQPELYGFGGTPFNEYYSEEAVRILEYLANHPSFVMFAWGNELNTTGSNRDGANALRELCRSVDDTRLYAEGSNNNYWAPSLNTGDDYWTTCKTKANSDPYHTRISFSWVDAASGGALESMQPNSNFTYTNAISIVDKPLMNHEAGQYQVLPLFDEEIPKYEPGVFEARNLQYYRDLMERKGLLHMNEIFSKVSARVSAIGYRADMETALRTPGLGGYQLLSIQDFPGQGTAHVGILDNFMEDKPGGFTTEQYKSFNDSVVVLAQLPKLVYRNDQELSGMISVVNYSPASLQGKVGQWKLKNGDAVLAEGSFDAMDVPQGSVTNLGTFSASLSDITDASKLTVEVSVDSIGSNSYDVWVYPQQIDTAVPAGVIVSSNLDEATLNALENGGKVLYLPEPSEKIIPDSVAVRWTTDYWSKMFHRSDRNAHTMGMYVQNEHPIFANFPTDFFSDYQWFNLMKGSRAVVLDNAPADLEPLAWNIDHMEWSRKLGSLFEANVGKGKLVVCTFDLLNQMDAYPEAKQLYASILQYMASETFQPKAVLTQEYLTDTFKELTNTNAYSTIEAESYTEGNGSFKSESGTTEDGEKATALGNINKGNWLRYEKVEFGLNGCSTITLNGANANSYDAVLELRTGSSTGPLIATLHFKNTGSWSQYKSQTFDIPRISGLNDVVLVSQNGGIAFNSFWFGEGSTQYVSAYEKLEPESAAGDITITDIDGGSHVIMQNYVSAITDRVEIRFNHVEFGAYGSKDVTIQGRSLNGKDVSGYLRYEDAGEETTIPFIFKAGEGESYELSSETFFKQTFKAKGIKGAQNLVIGFDPGTSFDLEALLFTGYTSEPVVNPDYVNAMNEAREKLAAVENRPLLYTEASWQMFTVAYEEASQADMDDNDAIAAAAKKLQGALDSLVLTGKSKSAYTITYARNYDEVDGSVKLERAEPDQVVGGFDKGETLIYKGLDFGGSGAMKLTVRAANGRSDSEKEKEAVLRFRYGTGENDYADVRILQTGGWGAANDRDFTVDISPELFNGVKDISLQLVEGAVALHSFVFEEAVVTDPQLLNVQWNPSQADVEITGEADVILDGNGIYGATVVPGTKLTFTFTPANSPFASAKLNGADIPFEADGFTYTYIMPNDKTVLRFTFTSVNKDVLESLLEKANEVTDEQLNKLVESVRKKFISARDNAKTVYESDKATQDEVNEAWKELLNAMHYLSFEEGTKDKLEYWLDYAAQLDLDNFTPKSQEGYTEALAYAQEVYDDEGETLKAEVEKAAKNLHEAILRLEFKANTETLEAFVKQAQEIEIDKYLDGPEKDKFNEILPQAEALLEDANATQKQVDEMADALYEAMMNLRMIPDKEALKALIDESEALNPEDYTAASYAILRAALNTALNVYEDENATQEEITAVCATVEKARAGLVPADKPEEPAKPSNKPSNSGSSGSKKPVGNVSGAGTAVAVTNPVVSAAQNVMGQKSVCSDTTANFTLKRGSAYCFKMTVVNGSSAAPNFTVGDGNVLKTQFVAKIGNDCYYRIWAVGTPGQSTGVYTTMSGEKEQQHCVVTVG